MDENTAFVLTLLIVVGWIPGLAIILATGSAISSIIRALKTKNNINKNKGEE